jgi:sulfite reductase alpha subunit-like flavoprotein
LFLFPGALVYLSAKQEELYDYTSRVRRTILEVLSEFRSVRVPRDYIFELFPPLRPREFSIASASQAHPHKVQLCVAIVDYKTKLKARRRGVGTSFLASLPVGASRCFASIIPVTLNSESCLVQVRS